MGDKRYYERMAVIKDENKIKELLTRYVEKVFPSLEKAEEMLKSGKELTFYLGVDPTGPSIHLGNATNLLVLKKLINLGHRIIFLIGDFTARVGDPTGKDLVRKSLSQNDIKENMKSYTNQVEKILPRGSFSVEYNSKWYNKFGFGEIIDLTSKFTVQQMIVRDMFQERLKNDKPIHVHEFLYPIMQGYDSVAMEVDGEIGGNDQTFNMLVGRDLVKDYLGKEKLVITTKLLVDPKTGKKIMNKSEGSYIAVNDSPDEMFGNIMAVPDSSIIPLFDNATELSDAIIQEVVQRLQKGDNPKILKEELGHEIVKMYHGEQEADRAKENFNNVFSEGKNPEEINEVENKENIIQTIVVAGIVSSKSEAKRLINQGAVKVNDKTVEEWEYKLKSGDTVKIGPRKFLKIK